MNHEQIVNSPLSEIMYCQSKQTTVYQSLNTDNVSCVHYVS